MAFYCAHGRRYLIFRSLGNKQMLIGVPREIKPQEYRVGLTPESVAELVHRGHEVLVETQAGAGIGADDRSTGQRGPGSRRRLGRSLTKPN